MDWLRHGRGPILRPSLQRNREEPVSSDVGTEGCLEPDQRLITGDVEEGNENLQCFQCGTNSENLDPLPAGTECGVLDSFGNRCGVCGSSGECIRTSPDLVACGDL